MILKKQKTFNSQAQKLRRAKIDMKEGLAHIKETFRTTNPNKTMDYIKASEKPLDMKAAANPAKDKIALNQKNLRHFGRGTVVKEDTSLIGKRGVAEKIGTLDKFKQDYAKDVKRSFSNKKAIYEIEQLIGSRSPIEKGDYVTRAARSMVDKETQKEVVNRIAAEKAASKEAEMILAKELNAADARAKFAIKKADILAKRKFIKEIKGAGKMAAGVGLGIAAGIGGYKAYQHFKNKKKDDNTKG